MFCFSMNAAHEKRDTATMAVMRRSYLKALGVMLIHEPVDVFLFLGDVVGAIPKGPKRVYVEVISWHHTVQIWQDPELLDALLHPSFDDDYGEVPRPTSVEQWTG